MSVNLSRPLLKLSLATTATYFFCSEFNSADCEEVLLFVCPVSYHSAIYLGDPECHHFGGERGNVLSVLSDFIKLCLYL